MDVWVQKRVRKRRGRKWRLSFVWYIFFLIHYDIPSARPVVRYMADVKNFDITKFLCNKFDVGWPILGPHYNSYVGLSTGSNFISIQCNADSSILDQLCSRKITYVVHRPTHVARLFYIAHDYSFLLAHLPSRYKPTSFFVSFKFLDWCF